MGDTVQAPATASWSSTRTKRMYIGFGSWETEVYRYDGKSLVHYTTEHGLPNNSIDEDQRCMDQVICLRVALQSQRSSVLTAIHSQKLSPVLIMYLESIQPGDLWLDMPIRWKRHIVSDGDTLACTDTTKTTTAPFLRSTASIRTGKGTSGSALTRSAYAI